MKKKRDHIAIKEALAILDTQGKDKLGEILYEIAGIAGLKNFIKYKIKDFFKIQTKEESEEINHDTILKVLEVIQKERNAFKYPLIDKRTFYVYGTNQLKDKIKAFGSEKRGNHLKESLNYVEEHLGFQLPDYLRLDDTLLDRLEKEWKSILSGECYELLRLHHLHGYKYQEIKQMKAFEHYAVKTISNKTRECKEKYQTQLIESLSHDE